MNDAQERGRQREAAYDEVLTAMYARVGADTQMGVFTSHLAPELGWEQDRLIKVSEEMRHRDLLKLISTGPRYAMTWEGIDRIEAKLKSEASSELVAAVEKAEQARLAVLHHVYNLTELNEEPVVSDGDIATATGLTEYNEANVVIRWLMAHGYLERRGWGTRVTPDAVAILERSSDEPEEPPAPGVAAQVVITNSPGAVVQQHSPGATIQVIQVVSDEKRNTELQTLLREVRQLVEVNASAPEAAAAEAALASTQAQAELGRSDSGIIRGGLGELYHFAQSVNAGLVASLILKFLNGE